MGYKPKHLKLNFEDYDPLGKATRKAYILLGAAVLSLPAALLASNFYEAPGKDSDPKAVLESDVQQDLRRQSLLGVAAQIHVETAYKMRNLGNTELCQESVDKLHAMEMPSLVTIDCQAPSSR